MYHSPTLGCLASAKIVPAQSRNEKLTFRTYKDSSKHIPKPYKDKKEEFVRERLTKSTKVSGKESQSTG